MTDISTHTDPLLRLFRSGDEQAFTAIYDRFYFTIYQYAKYWLNDGADAEDITADTFIKLLQRREQFESMNAIEGFLKVTVRNACFDFLKHRRVRTDKREDLLYALTQEVDPDFNWVEVQETYLNLIYAEVEKLPAKMKEVFLLSYRDGLKPAAVAEKLGITVRTVSNQKTTALHLLRAALANQPLLLAFLLLLDAEAGWWMGGPVNPL